MLLHRPECIGCEGSRYVTSAGTPRLIVDIFFGKRMQVLVIGYYRAIIHGRRVITHSGKLLIQRHIYTYRKESKNTRGPSPKQDIYMYKACGWRFRPKPGLPTCEKSNKNFYANTRYPPVDTRSVSRHEATKRPNRYLLLIFSRGAL
jgi:hypothetical protein